MQIQNKNNDDIQRNNNNAQWDFYLVVLQSNCDPLSDFILIISFSCIVLLAILNPEIS